MLLGVWGRRGATKRPDRSASRADRGCHRSGDTPCIAVSRPSHRQQPFLRYRWLKLSLVCHLSSHLRPKLSVKMEVMQQAAQQIGWHQVLADAAYDGEHNHLPCREPVGPFTLIPLNRCNSGRR